MEDLKKRCYEMINTPSLRDTPLVEGKEENTPLLCDSPLTEGKEENASVRQLPKHPSIEENEENYHLFKGSGTINNVLNSPLAEGCSGNVRSGVFSNYKALPYNPALKERAKELRKAGNLSEVLFWNQVKRNQFLNLDFHRQKIIGNYIVDFFCPELNLVVEIDGESHNYKIEYDEKREEYLESLGLKIVHYNDIDIKRNLSGVMEDLKKRCYEMINTLSLGKKVKNTPRFGKHRITPLWRGMKINTPLFRDTPLIEENEENTSSRKLSGYSSAEENEEKSTLVERYSGN